MARGFERPPWWAVAVMVAGAVFLAVGSVLVAHRPPPPAFAAPATTATTTPPANVRLAVIGDSITQGDSSDFSAGQIGSLSWVRYALGDDGIVFAGGWAVHGATSAEMLQQATRVKADVLVMLLGTNDTGANIPFGTTAANLKSIAATVGAPRVIVSSIPPRDADPSIVPPFNQQLQAYAQAQGWEFVDAMAGVRDGDHYAPGMTSDGIHPTLKASEIIGAAIRAQILHSHG